MDGLLSPLTKRGVLASWIRPPLGMLGEGGHPAGARPGI